MPNPIASAILVINAGSSSLKYALYRIDDGALLLVQNGLIDKLQSAPHFVAKDADGATVASRDWPQGALAAHDGAIAFLLEFLAGPLAWQQARRGRPSRRARRRAVSRPGADHARDRRRPRTTCSARAAAPAAQSRANPHFRAARAVAAAGGVLRHRVSCDRAQARAGVRAATRDERRRHPTLWLSRPVVRVHRRAPARNRRVPRRRAASSLRISATERRCARWSAARVWRRRWG